MERTANTCCGLGRRMSPTFWEAPELDMRINVPTPLPHPTSWLLSYRPCTTGGQRTWGLIGLTEGLYMAQPL